MTFGQCRAFFYVFMEKSLENCRLNIQKITLTSNETDGKLIPNNITIYNVL